MPALVSVLIPCYNAAPWLRACLDSVAAQTWPACEIVVVDDGSSDESVAVAESFFREKTLGRLLRQQNAGAAAARQRAFETAQGEFIQYLDADDVLHPDKIRRQMERLQRLPSHVASGPWTRFSETPSTDALSPSLNWKDLTPTEYLQVTFASGSMMHPASWLVPRKIAEKAGPWNPTLNLDDDGEYFSRVVLSSKGIAFCEGALSYYRSNLSGSLSRRRDRKAWESAYEACRSSTELLIAAENSPRTRSACAVYWMNLAFAAYPEGGDVVEKARTRARSLDPEAKMPERGPRFNLLSRMLGWRLAKRLQRSLAEASGSTS